MHTNSNIDEWSLLENECKWAGPRHLKWCCQTLSSTVQSGRGPRISLGCLIFKNKQRKWAGGHGRSCGCFCHDPRICPPKWTSHKNRKTPLSPAVLLSGFTHIYCTKPKTSPWHTSSLKNSMQERGNTLSISLVHLCTILTLWIWPKHGLHWVRYQKQPKSCNHSTNAGTPPMLHGKMNLIYLWSSQKQQSH